VEVPRVDELVAGREAADVLMSGRSPRTAEGDAAAEFDAFVASSVSALLRTAYLLTGDRGYAEDLLQAALLRVFRQSTGITPHQYLMRLRLQRAIALLRDTQLPIIDIAYASGWADLSNFNRAFRREMKCSPREFRRGDAKLLSLETPAGTDADTARRQ